MHSSDGFGKDLRARLKGTVVNPAIIMISRLQQCLVGPVDTSGVLGKHVANRNAVQLLPKPPIGASLGGRRFDRIHLRAPTVRVSGDPRSQGFVGRSTTTITRPSSH